MVLAIENSTTDTDVIRRYFEVDNHGEKLLHGYKEGVIVKEERMAMADELLIRSENQSLLVDMPVALIVSD